MKSQYVLPITIVVAGALIAGAVFLAGSNGNSTTTGSGTTLATTKVPAFNASSDHILGSPSAPVKVIEYADLECPFCKVFETTMHQVMDYYGQSGEVAWIYRPFPLAQLHSKAPEEAEAAECAAEQGGSEAYFKYIDQIYSITPSDNGLDLSQLPVVAGNIGLNVDSFNQCLASGKYAQKIQQNYNDAIAAGGQGTPFIAIMVGNDAITLQGAQPYDSMRAAIDAVIAQLPPSEQASSTTSASSQ